MNKYLVVNTNDGNDVFEVEASNAQDAAFLALQELGWFISETPTEDEEEAATSAFDSFCEIPVGGEQ